MRSHPHKGPPRWWPTIHRKAPSKAAEVMYGSGTFPSRGFGSPGIHATAPKVGADQRRLQVSRETNACSQFPTKQVGVCDTLADTLRGG